MFRKTMLSVAAGLLCVCVSEAGPITVRWTSGTTMEMGTWYEGDGVLDSAKARASELGVPLLVLWTSSSCGHCAAFERAMDGAEFIDYLANRGLIMVYGQDNTGGPIKRFVGSGEYPLWRVQWLAGSVDHKGQYPKNYSGFRAELEGQISGYVPGTTADTSKDDYDPESDAVGTAPTLAWQTAATSESLRLSHGTDYTDLTDWYKFNVVAGNTYNIWFSGVTGQSQDAVMAAVYADAGGTTALGGPVSLASGDFEFFAGADSTVYVKVWRTTANDDAILYTMSYQRQSVGTLPAASYQGWVGDLNKDGVQGTVSLSVNNSGKISGKAVFPAKGPLYAGSYTLSSAEYSMISNGTVWVTASFTRSGNALPVVLGVDTASGRVVGSLGADPEVFPLELYRDDWATASMAALAEAFSGYYTAAFPNCCARWPDDAPGGSGFAAITLDKKGRFKVAGKLGDGTALSQSGVLFLRPGTTVANPVLCALLYSAPNAYKGGRFGGVITFSDTNTNGVIDVSMGYGEKLVWNSLEPLSVPIYEADSPGFESWLAAVGGWYNRLEDLNAYYAGLTIFVDDLEEPPALAYQLTLLESDGAATVTTRSDETALASSWQATATNLAITVKANGSGFSAPTSDLKLLGYGEDGAPIYNYDSGVNPNGLTVAFNRTTGVMSGSFKIYYDYVVKQDSRSDPETLTWKHSQKVATYASILLLEQADSQSDLVSDGYFLVPDSSVYETSTGTQRKYTLKRSYEFATRSKATE